MSTFTCDETQMKKVCSALPDTAHYQHS